MHKCFFGIDLITWNYVYIDANICMDMDVYQLILLPIRKNLWTKTSWPCPLPQNDLVPCHRMKRSSVTKRLRLVQTPKVFSIAMFY